jgi:hypothetical protein
MKNGRERIADGLSPGGEVAVHIERLVLEGVPLTAGQGGQLRTAIIGELHRLIEQRGLEDPLPSGSVPIAFAPQIEISSPARPLELGRQIARSLHESLSRPV